MSARRPSSLVVAILLVPVALVAAVFFVVRSAPIEFGARPWQRVDMILIPSIADEETAASRLIAAGDEILYFGNATVSVEDFAGGAVVPLPELTGRFDEADPRLDPFLRALPGLFHPPGGEQPSAVLYRTRSGSPVETWLHVRRVLDGVPFRIAGWQPVIPLASGLAVLVALIPVLVTARRRRLPIAVTHLLAAVYGVVGGPEALVPAVLLGTAFSYWHVHSADIEREYLVHRRRGVRIEREQVPALVFLVLAAIGAVALPAERRAAVLIVVAMVLVWAWVVLIHALRIDRSEHPLFAPRPILRTRVTFPGLIPALIVVASASVAFVLAGTGTVPAGTPTVPVPEHLAVGQQPTRDPGEASALVEGLRSVSATAEPLSTAGYLAHRWYQDTLLYGGTFRVPSLGDRITIQRLRREGAGLSAYREPVREFGPQWVAEQFREPQGTAYTLFTQEEGAFRVVRTPLQLTVVSPTGTMRRLAMLILPLLALASGMRLPYRGLLGTVGAASRSERHEL